MSNHYIYHREAVPRPIPCQGAIMVAGDDYEWDNQRSDPLTHRHPHFEENTSRSLNHTSIRAISRTVTNTFANLSLAESANALSQSQDGQIRAKLRAKDKKIRRLEKDAAKTAATYYGECYLEGVGVGQADEAARKSHQWYKKWWLQEIPTEERMTSFGDAIGLPIYSSTPPESSPSPLPSLADNIMGPVDPILNDRSGQPSGEYYAVENSSSYKPLILDGIGESARLTATSLLDSPEPYPHMELIDAAWAFDRSSGACHPSPVDRTFVSNHHRPIATESSTGKRPSSLRNNGQRSIDSLSKFDTLALSNGRSASGSSTDKTIYQPKSPPYSPGQFHDTNSKAKNIMTTSIHYATESMNDNITSGYRGIETYETTDDEVDGGMSIPPEAHWQAFDRTRNRRLEKQRRGNTFSDHEDELSSSHGKNKRKGAQAYRESVKRHQARYRHNGKKKINAIMTLLTPLSEHTARIVDNAKLELLRILTISGGDVTDQSFLKSLEQLRALHVMTDFDARSTKPSEKYLEGNWLTISRPHFTECLGQNTNGDYMYTLGRMSFDLFGPGNLVCSISGIFNSIQVDSCKNDIKSVPKSLRDEVTKGKSILRKYEYVFNATIRTAHYFFSLTNIFSMFPNSIVTAFKIEQDSPLFGPHSPNRNVHRALRGTITTYGHVLPDPKKPNRLSIWFSGGKIEPSSDQQDLDLWKKAFGGGQIKRHLQEKARILAAKILLGATVPSAVEDDGSMEFVLTRPIGGHGSTYVDVLYLDNSLRIVQGNKGSLFVMTRVSC
eukprot:scaffold1288_cov286-Chaetoceros_neogracile.AAC.16